MASALKPGREMPPEPEPTEQEIRWRAEDRWLDRQWHLMEDL